MHLYHVHTMYYIVIFFHTFCKFVILYLYTVFHDGGCVDRELSEQVMIERVELIARLTTEGTCQERDREIALNLIAEIARDKILINKSFSVFFRAKSSEKK